jgi:non-specific serine/threonine protein kinase
MIRGHLVEGRRWTERALEAGTELPPELESRLLKAAALLVHEMDDLETVQGLTYRRLGLARERGDKAEIARCLNNLGLVAQSEGDTQRAAILFRESISLNLEAGEPIDVPLGNLARMAFRDDDFDRAEALACESLAIARERGDLEQTVAMNQFLSFVRMEQGRLGEAVEIERNVLRLAQRLQYKNALRTCSDFCAILLARRGNASRAAQLMGKARALRAEDGRPPPDSGNSPLLSRAEALVRSELSEQEWLEAMSVGQHADLEELLEAALQEAEASASLGTP